MNIAGGELITGVGLPAEAVVMSTLISTKGRALRAMQVKDDDEFEVVAKLVQEQSGLGKDLETARKTVTEPLDRKKKEVMDAVRPYLEEVDRSVAIGKKNLVDYHNAVEEARAKAQREAQALQQAEEKRLRDEADRIKREAEQRAADEKKAADEKAEADRLEAEKKMQSAVASGDTKTAVAAAREIDAVDQRHELAVQSIESARVETVTAAVPTVTAPRVTTYVPPAPRVAGVATRKTYKFEIVDKDLLIKAAAERLAAGDRMLISLLEVNESAVRQLVTSLKENAAIPGVRVYEDTGIAAGRRR